MGQTSRYLEALQNKFNKTIDKDITIYESYLCFVNILIIKIINRLLKNIIKYIDKVILKQYIKTVHSIQYF